MADAVGQMYVERHFSQEAKEEMPEMIHNLQAALAARIKAQTWMCDRTKALALEKPADYKIKVGFPDEWDDLTGLVIDPAKSLYENIREAGEFYWGHMASTTKDVSSTKKVTSATGGRKPTDSSSRLSAVKWKNTSTTCGQSRVS